MSDFALKFIPNGPTPPEVTPPQDKPFASRFIPGADAEQPVEPDTGLVQQGMSGINEGIGIGLGTPVDLVTSGINGVAGLAGYDPVIDNPVLGSQWINDNVLAPTISEVDPQTAGQRFARRIGQEVGQGVTTAPLLATGVGAPITKGFMGTNAASDVGAGIAGQTAREIAPDSAIADIVSTLVGGTATAGSIAAASRTRPKAPTRAELQESADEAYNRVRESGAELTDDASQGYLDAVRSRFDSEGGDALSSPKANSQINLLAKNPRQSVIGLEETRRRFRDHVARNPDEGAMGQKLIDETEDYLRNLKTDDLTGADPQRVISDLLAGRKAAHSYIKHDTISDALDQANRRASTSGTGGNALNAQSQEIGRIYDREVARRPGGAKGSNKSGGYTPDEVKAMEKIVYPSRTERTMQRVGRWSPSTGALQSQAALVGGGGGVGAAIATGNPILAAGAIPAGIGITAQALAERTKQGNIDELVDTILRGGTAVRKSAPNGVKRAIVSQLLNTATVPN
ncbi:MAG: hypothetical protein ACPG4X_16885 [Pikeienuella sp.]